MKRLPKILLLSAMLSALGACGSDDSGVSPIASEGDTALPAFTGQAATAQPLDPAGAPQNPYLAQNPFSNYHNDTWMSDAYDIPAPLGKSPVTWSSNLAAARDPGAPPNLLHCGTIAFDSRGRIVTICSNPVQTTAVLVDPEKLSPLTWLNLPAAGNKSAGLGAGYMLLDNLDRAWVPVGNQLVVVSQTTGPGGTSFAMSEHDVSSVVPPGDAINSLVPDAQGRIWFVVRYAGIIGLLDPKTGAVQKLQLGEEISNSFSVDGNDAYIVTTSKLYRLSAGSDNVPTIVWSAAYQNIGRRKTGQLSAGSGTTPTILGQGKYVAIADNADQTHVVVYRTDEQLSAGVDRKVCEVDVFEPGKGAVEDSLVGFGRTLIVTNNYGYSYNPNFVDFGSLPGMARVDIDADGNGCEKIWSNSVVNAASYGAKVSTQTGLAYVVARKSDPNRKVYWDYPLGMNVWYWTAIDVQTGKTVWEQLAGTGRWFDGYWPLPFIGPNGALYAAGNGGIFAMRDAR